MKFSVFILVSLIIHSCNGYLKVEQKSFHWNGERIYLNGVNIAWKNENGKFCHDWGNGEYYKNKDTLNRWLDGIHEHGGNAARVWLHFQGESSPKWDKNGFVSGTDNQGFLIKEMQSFLDEAAKRDIFIIFTLWNAAIIKKEHQALLGLMHDEKKLQSYIDHALKPMVEGLKGKKALAAWEIMNEPEGLFNRDIKSSEPCFDGGRLAKGGFLSEKMAIKTMLKFFNWQSDAIHSVDPSALVTVGTWNERSNTNKCQGCFNFYSDHCLQLAGGRQKGHLDFYQMHTYEWHQWTPYKTHADSYGLDKPLIVGEFSSRCSETKDPNKNFHYFYNNGYSGALSWQYNDHDDECMDNRDTQNKGMNSIRGETKHGKIKVHIG